MSSLTDVARRAGVSIATVSRVIHNSKKVVPKTQAVVRKAMAELGSKPNRVARRLRQKGRKRHLLGLIIPDIQNPFFAEMACGVEDVAYANEFAVLLCNSDDHLPKERFYRDVMRAESVDGLILPPIHERDPAVMELAESGLPIVTVDRSLAIASIDKVEVDNRGGAFEAVEFLIRRGHQRIGLIAGRANVSTSRERRQGYEEALRAHGLDVMQIVICKVHGSGPISVRDLLFAKKSKRLHCLLVGTEPRLRVCGDQGQSRFRPAVARSVDHRSSARHGGGHRVAADSRTGTPGTGEVAAGL